MSSWKISLVVLSFTPLIILAGKIMGGKENEAQQGKQEESNTEEAGKVRQQSSCCLILIR